MEGWFGLAGVARLAGVPGPAGGILLGPMAWSTGRGGSQGRMLRPGPRTAPRLSIQLWSFFFSCFLFGASVVGLEIVWRWAAARARGWVFWRGAYVCGGSLRQGFRTGPSRVVFFFFFFERTWSAFKRVMRADTGVGVGRFPGRATKSAAYPVWSGVTSALRGG